LNRRVLSLYAARPAMAKLPVEKIEEILAEGPALTPEDKRLKELFARRVKAARQARREDRETMKQVGEMERTRRACYDALVDAGHAMPDWQPIEQMHPDATPSDLLVRSKALRDEWKAQL